MKQLAGSAAYHINRLTRSGKDVCRRILPFSKKNKATEGENEVSLVVEAEQPSAEQPTPTGSEPVSESTAQKTRSLRREKKRLVSG